MVLFVLSAIAVIAAAAYAAVALFRSQRPVYHILAEIRYELMYNAMGSKALIEDFWLRSRNKMDLPRRSGGVAVVTGGARGIGTEIVRMLLLCDVHVIIGCRKVAAGQKLFEKLRESGITTGNVTVFELDTACNESVKSFAKKVSADFPKIHLLINNAGIMFGPYKESVDGYESQFAVNYLGHFLLTHLLLDNVKEAGRTGGRNARIVNVTSCAHEAGDIDFDDINMRKMYISASAYAQSKLAQVLFTHYLNELLRSEGTPVQVHSVHPGIVNTELFEGTHLKNAAPWAPKLFFKTPTEGATPIVYAALSPELEGKGGTYISNCVVTEPSLLSKDLAIQKKLFEFTNSILGIEEFGSGA